MRFLKRIFILLLLVSSFLIMQSNLLTTVAYTYAHNEISANSYLVIERDSGRVLYEKNAYNKSFLASTTKILTAITIIENFDINQRVKICKSSTNIEGSSIYLEEGEILTIKDLLFGLMLRSGNDCAEALASSLCSRDEFINLMNKKAKEVGALQSNFTNPHGLHDENHYTTAYDLALISAHAMKNEIFREIVSTKQVRIPFTTRNTCRLLINKNKMLKSFEGCNGIKTGYTKKAGRCLVSSCLRNGMEVICVVLNCPNMWEDSKTLLSNSFNNYKNYLLLNSNDILKFINIENSNDKCGVYVRHNVILPLTEAEFNSLNIEFDLPNTIKKNIKKDTNIGEVKIYSKNNLLFTEKIYTIIDV